MSRRNLPKSRAAAQAAASSPEVRFRLRIRQAQRIAVGPGKIELLEAVRDTGSITAAAKRLDMSYRRAWLLLDELNRCLASPAVDSAHGGAQGGGSHLTRTGEELVLLYRRIEQTAASSCAGDIERLKALLAAP